MTKMYKVEYQAAMGRHIRDAVDYMQVKIDEVELYAEAVNDTWDDELEAYTDEAITYDDLKDAIIEQAEENGIDPKMLNFWFDNGVLNANGTRIDYPAAVEGMDDETREALHAELAPCTDQEFFTAYEAAHLAKFGEEWELSKANPVW